jgi:hypothetical protein
MSVTALELLGEIVMMRRIMMDEETRSKVVEAVAHAGGSGKPGVSAKDIEKAVAEAIQKAYDQGISDPDQIREISLQARRSVVPK